MSRSTVQDMQEGSRVYRNVDENRRKNLPIVVFLPDVELTITENPLKHDDIIYISLRSKRFRGVG